MLTGMNKLEWQILRPECANERIDLHEIWTGAGDNCKVSHEGLIYEVESVAGKNDLKVVSSAP